MMASRNNNTSVSRNANGNRRSQFKLEAASSDDKPSTGPTYLIYVGKLSKLTTVNSVRDHLRQIGLPNEDVADVLQLKCKNINEKSFCVSIHSPSGKDKLYDPHNWPLGVRVRPFRRTPTRSPRRFGHQNKASSVSRPNHLKDRHDGFSYSSYRPAMYVQKPRRQIQKNYAQNSDSYWDGQNHIVDYEPRHWEHNVNMEYPSQFCYYDQDY